MTAIDDMRFNQQQALSVYKRQKIRSMTNVSNVSKISLPSFFRGDKNRCTGKNAFYTFTTSSNYINDCRLIAFARKAKNFEITFFLLLLFPSTIFPRYRQGKLAFLISKIPYSLYCGLRQWVQLFPRYSYNDWLE